MRRVLAMCNPHFYFDKIMVAYIVVKVKVIHKIRCNFFELKSERKPVDTKLCYLYNTVRKCIAELIQCERRDAVMISFEGLQMTDTSPIYMQILLYIKRGVVAGTITDGDELPSRRMLSALLGVNPNTVQKAYRLLEEEGLIHSHTGAKSCMVLTPERIARIREELLEEDARQAVEKLRQMGVSMDEAFALIRKYWN